MRFKDKCCCFLTQIHVPNTKSTIRICIQYYCSPTFEGEINNKFQRFLRFILCSAPYKHNFNGKIHCIYVTIKVWRKLFRWNGEKKISMQNLIEGVEHSIQNMKSIANIEFSNWIRNSMWLPHCSSGKWNEFNHFVDSLSHASISFPTF